MNLPSNGTLVFIGVLFILSIGQCTAQEKVEISGQITEKTGVPVSFATIKVANKSEGTYSDNNGYFTLTCRTSDTLKISAIGFISKSIAVLNPDLNVVLTEKAELLDEVVIVPKNFETKKIELGNFKKKSNGGFLGEYASMLKIDNHERIQGDIIKVIFKLYKSRKGKDAFSDDLHFDEFEFKETLVRLLLFEKATGDSDSLISLIKSNITKKVNAKDKEIEFQVDTLNISMPDKAIFIGIEMLGYFDNTKFVPFNSENDVQRIQQFRYEFSTKHSHPQSWTKHGIGDPWKLHSIPHNGFFNFNYGIVVREYKNP